MKLDKFEYSKKEGLIVDNKKYGYGIRKIEFDSDTISIYVSKYSINHFDEIKKLEGAKEYNNPKELEEYKNVKIIEE